MAHFILIARDIDGEIDPELLGFLVRTHCRCVVVEDKSGCTLYGSGETHRLDGMSSDDLLALVRTVSPGLETFDLEDRSLAKAA